MRRIRPTLIGLSVCALCAGAALGQQDDPIGSVINSLPEETTSPQADAAPADEGDGIPTTTYVNIQPADPPPSYREAEEGPSTRARHPIAVVQVVDKVTAASSRFDLPLDRPTQYESLTFTAHACESEEADDPARGATAHLQIDFLPPVTNARARPQSRRVYQGWMYAEAPSVSPLEHPIYDAWLVACKAE